MTKKTKHFVENMNASWGIFIYIIKNPGPRKIARATRIDVSTHSLDLF